MQVAPNGRVFFIDHNERATTWVDPRTGRASPMPNQTHPPNRRPEDELGTLPEGWEERVHTDGRIFFIDHSKYFFLFICVVSLICVLCLALVSHVCCCSYYFRY